MSVTRFVEIDGKRHDISKLPEVTEHRCDHDGEFIEPADMVIVHGQVTGRGVADSFSLDLHAGEVEHAGPAIVRQILERNPGAQL